MARFVEDCMAVDDRGTRALLSKAADGSGSDYELAVGSCIGRRRIPLLERIEAATGIPIVGVSMEGTRGPRSSQSKAWFQWQRGHRKDAIRWPDATVEFIGPGGVPSHVYALEISLQTDFTKIGDSAVCSMSMAKASQIAWTASILASKPAYSRAAIHYWYLCPWRPSEDSRQRVLIPLQNMSGTHSVTLTWMRIDHGTGSA